MKKTEKQLSFLDELEWRGLIHDVTPGLKEAMEKEMIIGYIGFDPTAPSLTIGNYVQIMLLTFLQKAGHKPVVLMGGATGRIGDPSGKDEERKLKSYEELDQNLAHQVKQIRKMLNFSPKLANGAILVNNYAFYKKMDVIAFLRDVGKYLTVNYMMSKESVKRRIETGISFTEFSYQLLQGYDYVLLNEHYGVTLQMGGSDQYGNITSGIELGRKINEKKFYGVTTPLLTKEDGTKFGKSAEGNIWLDPNLTSPYRFYQFWINGADQDFPKFYRYFSLKSKAEIEDLETKYASDQKRLKEIFAEELTIRLHGKRAFEAVRDVSRILFDSRLSVDALRTMQADTLQQVSAEIPTIAIAKSAFAEPVPVLQLLTELTDILPSKSEAKNAIKNNAISVNKVKITNMEAAIGADEALSGGYILIESGKKNKYLISLV